MGLIIILIIFFIHPLLVSYGIVLDAILLGLLYCLPFIITFIDIFIFTNKSKRRDFNPWDEI